MAKATEVEILLRAPNAQLERDLADSNRKLDRFAKGTTSAFGRLSNAIRGAFNIDLARLGTVVGVGALGASLAFATKRALDFASELKDTAANTGVTITALQELRFAAAQSGVSIGAFDQALVFLNRNLSEAASDKNSQAALAFERIGVAVRDSEGNIRKTDDALTDLLARVGALTSSAERVDISKTLLGRGGAELGKLAIEGADGIARLRAEAHLLGTVLDEETVLAAEAAGDKFDALFHILKTQGIQAILEFTPELTALAEALTTVSRAASEFFDGFRDDPRTLAGIAEQLETARGNLHTAEWIEWFAVFGTGASAAAREVDALKKKIDELQGEFADRAFSGEGFDVNDPFTPRDQRSKAELPGKLGEKRDPQAEGRAAKELAALRRSVAAEERRASAELSQSIRRDLDAQRESEELLTQIARGRLQAEADLAEAVGDTTLAEEKRAQLIASSFEAERGKVNAQILDAEDRQRALADLAATESATLAAAAEEASEEFKHLQDFAIDGLTGALADLALTGELTFRSLGESFLREFVQVAIKEGVTELAKALSAVASSFGGSGTGGGTAGWAGALASILTGIGGGADGRIFNHPTLSWVAEKRPEVALSAAQLRDFAGSSGGGGGVEVVVNNHGPTPATARVGRGSNGKTEIEVMIQRVVLGDVGTNGPITQGLTKAFSLTRSGGRRG